MTFTFAQPLKLLAIGGSLITSSSFWFFGSSVPLQVRSSSGKGVSKDSNPNLNTLDPVPKLSELNGKTITDDKIKDQSFDTSQRHYKFKLKVDDSEKILFYPSNDLDNLELGNVLGFKDEYEKFDKKSIQIKLFSKYAWHTTDGEEEFQSPLDEGKINELFTDVDETKTKQLLLSLQKSRIWKVNGTFNPSANYYYPDIRQPKNTNDLDGLKDLKIKYFTDFKDLKDYVHKKVKGSCTEDNKACVAHKDELTILDMDKMSFFQEKVNQ